MRPYHVQEAVLASADRSLYHALTLVVAQRALLFPKVKLSALITSAPSHSKSIVLTQLGHHTIDFVFCDRRTTRPLFVVLVDGKSPAPYSQRSNNDHVEQLCESAGLSVLRISQEGIYRMDQLQRLIEPLLDGDSRGNDYTQGDRVPVKADSGRPAITRPGTIFSPN